MFQFTYNNIHITYKHVHKYKFSHDHHLYKQYIFYTATNLCISVRNFRIYITGQLKVLST